jgi:hypothetical protein
VGNFPSYGLLTIFLSALPFLVTNISSS